MQISPQFHYAHHSCSKRRQVRHRKCSKSSCLKQCKTLNKENKFCGFAQRTKCRLFPPLRFITNERKGTTVSDSNLLISKEKQIAGVMSRSTKTSKSYIQDKTIPRQQKQCDMNPDFTLIAPSSNTNRSFMTNCTHSQELNVEHGSDAKRRDTAFDSDCESQKPVVPHTSYNSIKKGKLREKTNTSVLLQSPIEKLNCLPNESNVHSLTPPFSVSVIHRRNSSFFRSPSEGNFDGAGMLRISRLSEEEQCTPQENDMSYYDIQHKHSSRYIPIAHSQNLREPLVEKCGSDTQIEHDSHTPRQSLRLRERYQEALKHFQALTPLAKTNRKQSQFKGTAILVSDTPEAEYNFTLRQRQLKRIISLHSS